MRDHSVRLPSQISGVVIVFPKSQLKRYYVWELIIRLENVLKPDFPRDPQAFTSLQSALIYNRSQPIFPTENEISYRL